MITTPAIISISVIFIFVAVVFYLVLRITYLSGYEKGVRKGGEITIAAYSKEFEKLTSQK